MLNDIEHISSLGRKFIDANYFLAVIALMLVFLAPRANASTYFDFRTSTGTTIITHGDGTICSTPGMNCKYVVINLGQPAAAILGPKYYQLNTTNFNILGGGCVSGALDIGVYDDPAYTKLLFQFPLAGSGTSPLAASDGINFNVPADKFAQLIFGCNDNGPQASTIDGGPGSYQIRDVNALLYSGLPNLCIGDTPADCSPTSVPAVGTIQVVTNLDNASFSINGPTVLTRSGRSAVFQNVPVGTYTINYGPTCLSGVPSNETKTLSPGQTLVFTGQYVPGFLSFPLDGFSPCTAPVSSVFDHSQDVPYANNGIVSAYTGESGSCDTSAPKQICQSQVTGTSHYGFTKPDETAFEVNGNYTGNSLTIKDFDCIGAPSKGKDGAQQASCALFLFYDGHPGFDYPAVCFTPVRAAVSGYIHYPDLIDNVIDGKKFHVLEIIPDTQPEYRVYYLHLATHPASNPHRDCEQEPIVQEGAHVNAGEIVGLVGHAGVISPHLHFEVHIITTADEEIPVDPYGWKPATPDFYLRAVNQNLWR